MQVAVVGHVEWVEFARVDHVPAPGEIVHALETWQEPAGGGAVAAVQLAHLAGECLFLTALGDDELGRRAARELGELGVRVEAAWRAEPQRRAFVHLDAQGELAPAPRFIAETDGAGGGSLTAADGSTSTWIAAPLPGPPVDAYGAGDSFAAGVTFGLAQGLTPMEAVELGARCGAAALTR